MSDHTQEAAEPPVAKAWYYICDHCGSIITITAAPIPEGEEWECDDCGSTAIWEFDNQENAMQHSRHIERMAASGLFRRGLGR